MDQWDVVVMGSGFGGSILASALSRRGLRVAMIEKGKHPRFAIGESSTPLANLLLEEIGKKFDLPELLLLAQWGSWQRTHPDIACGLKRGFTFYHHREGHDFDPGPDRENELLVGASPSDKLADTHWYRPQFDAHLVQVAQARGVEYVDECEILAVHPSPSDVRIRIRNKGSEREICALFVVDATGPRGVLSRLLKLRERSLNWMPSTKAVFGHFSNVERFSVRHPSGPGAPYEPDDAAVHHVFKGGWVWVLRFNNGLTSAGGIWTREAAAAMNLPEGPPSWAALLARFPGINAHLAGANAETPLHWMPSVSYACEEIVGTRWAMLPSAAGFIDPLLSTGFPLTLWGILRLVPLLSEGGTMGNDESLRVYARETKQDLQVAEDLISALYAAMPDFGSFKWISMLYFAGASYSELAWRLGVRERAGEFLLREEPRFIAPLRHLCERVRQFASAQAWPECRRELEFEVPKAIEAFDVAGLGKRRSRSWYPVDLNELMENAGKLGMSREAAERFVRESGD